MDEFDPDLGIRTRRSKNAKSGAKSKMERNLLTDHTLESDMPQIKEFAEKYRNLDPQIKAMVDNLMFKDKSQDFYYGMYVAYYQMFVIAATAENDLSETLTWLIYATAYQLA
jgi:hypothetical protein